MNRAGLDDKTGTCCESVIEITKKLVRSQRLSGIFSWRAVNSPTRTTLAPSSCASMAVLNIGTRRCKADFLEKNFVLKNIHISFSRWKNFLQAWLVFLNRRYFRLKSGEWKQKLPSVENLWTGLLKNTPLPPTLPHENIVHTYSRVGRFLTFLANFDVLAFLLDFLRPKKTIYKKVLDFG